MKDDARKNKLCPRCYHVELKRKLSTHFHQWQEKLFVMPLVVLTLPRDVGQAMPSVKFSAYEAAPLRARAARGNIASLVVTRG